MNKIILVFGIEFVMILIASTLVNAYPVITWEDPTIPDGETVSNNSVYLNTTITDAGNTSAFFDWNFSLVGYWSMDYVLTNGTVYDNSTYGNNGVMRNFSSNTTVDGRYGNSTEFDGSDDYIEVLDNLGLRFSNRFTIEFWMKPDSLIGGAKYLLVKGTSASANNYAVIWEWAANSVEFFAQQYTGTDPRIGSQIALSDTNWHHIVYTYNSTQWSGYLDGTEVFSVSRNFSLRTQSSSMSIGSADIVGQTGYNFAGKLDEIRFYNRSLSWEEINASYNNSQYRLYHNFTNLSDGNYNYAAYAIDSAGNLNITTSRSVNVSIDNTAPVMSAGPTTTQTSSSVTLSVTTDINANCKYSTTNEDYTAMSNSFSTGQGSTSHSTVVSSLTGGTTHIYYITCTSLTNVNATPTSVSFLVDLGGGLPDPNGGPGLTIQASIVSIRGGSQALFTYTEESLGIISIIFESTKDIYSGKIEITNHWTNLPDVVPSSPASEIIYKYVGIAATQIDSNAFETAKIKFRVPKSWFENNNIDPETTRLMRHTEE